MTFIVLHQATSLRTICPLPVPTDADDNSVALALQALCPEGIIIKPTPKGVTVTGTRGRKRLTYPFMNDAFFMAAVDLA